MGQVRKITANIPADILATAQRMTGKGVTLTLIEGLKALDRQARLSALRQARGKVDFQLDLDRTRR
jgi:hypothetical protein